MRRNRIVCVIAVGYLSFAGGCSCGDGGTEDGGADGGGRDGSSPVDAPARPDAARDGGPDASRDGSRGDAGDPCASPTTTETICDDLVDEDCDGATDCDDSECTSVASCAPLPCTITAPEVQLSMSTAGAGGSDVEWNGTSFDVVWQETVTGGFDYWFDSVAADGTATSATPVRVVTGTAAQPPFMVWNGTLHGLVWSDLRNGATESNDVYFNGVHPDGTTLGADAPIAARPLLQWWPGLAWNADDMHFAMAWTDGRDHPADGSRADIYFGRAEASGARVGTDMRVSNGIGYSEPALVAWTGTEYIVAFSEVDPAASSRTLYVRRVARDGTPTDAAVPVNSAGNAALRTMVWTGSELVLVWADDRHGDSEIYFGRVSSALSVLGERRITTSTGVAGSPSIVSNGSGFLLAWQDSRGGAPHIYVAFVATDGTRLSEHRFSCAEAEAYSPSLAYDGIDYALAWTDARGAQTDVFIRVFDQTSFFSM